MSEKKVIKEGGPLRLTKIDHPGEREFIYEMQEIADRNRQIGEIVSEDDEIQKLRRQGFRVDYPVLPPGTEPGE